MKHPQFGGLSGAGLKAAVEKGGHLVYYPYCYSLLFFTFNRRSKILLVKEKENRLLRGLPYIFISLLLGWWAIPFGPSRTLASLRINFNGGKDVTEEIMAEIAGYELFEESHQRRTA